MANGSRSSTPVIVGQSWVPWLVPSITDVIFIALLTTLLCRLLSMRLLGDGSIGWHIRAGQQILAEHAIPRVDIFSSTMRGKPWFAWEWLYDAMVGGLARITGLNGVVLLTAILIAIVFAWTFRMMLQRGTQVAVAVVMVMLAASASMIHFLARPHVVTWLFVLAWVWILDSSEAQVFTGMNGRRSRIVWLLPVTMLLWVNLHGGWLVGFVLLGIYWIAAVAQYFAAGEDTFASVLLRLGALQRAKQLFLVGVVSALATFVNPYGWKLHAHVYGYLTNRFLMDHIDEFQSPNFHGVAQRCFAGLILIALVAFGARTRRVRVSEGLLALFAIYSGLLASRNIPVASLLLAIVAGPRLSEAFGSVAKQWLSAPSAGLPTARSTFFGRMAALESQLRGHLWALVAIGVSCYIVFHGGFLGSRKIVDTQFDSRRFPASAVDFIERQPSADPVLAPDYWGGYLIYRLYPKRLVVADDRHDLYGEQFFKSYLKMMHLEPGWDDLIREYHVSRILMPRGSPLANLLAERPEWRLTYQDEVAELFERR